MMLNRSRRDFSDAEDGERRSALRRAQSEYLIAEQDKQKRMREAKALEMEVRRFDMERDRLTLKLEEKRLSLEKRYREIALLEAEERRLKKKVDLLSH